MTPDKTKPGSIRFCLSFEFFSDVKRIMLLRYFLHTLKILQILYGHRFIFANIFTDFTGEIAKITDFSVNNYTTDWFTENLTDSVVESTFLNLRNMWLEN